MRLIFNFIVETCLWFILFKGSFAFCNLYYWIHLLIIVGWGINYYFLKNMFNFLDQRPTLYCMDMLLIFSSVEEIIEWVWLFATMDWCHSSVNPLQLIMNQIWFLQHHILKSSLLFQPLCSQWNLGVTLKLWRVLTCLFYFRKCFIRAATILF